MFLEINFKNKNTVVSLILKDGKKVVDRADFQFERNLDQILVAGLDKILNKNKMSLLSLKKVRIAGKVKKDRLSYQIAQAFIKALALG